MDSSARLLLEGVDYFQVVFTLPNQLSRLALGNRKAIYDLLFQSAWSALNQTIQSEQGYDPAALMVLHTWNQKLDAHGHVHAIVPGGGPAADGSGWRVSRRDGDRLSEGDYLVDACVLREAYRDHFLRGLNRLWAAGKLKLQEEFAVLQSAAGWKVFTAQLETIDWVSHIEPPPEDCRPDKIVKYLARYLTGGPISDSRIVAADQKQVIFLAREGKVAGGESKQVPITLSAVEFTRRWALHVLPKAYKKSRRFGGFSNARRDDYLEKCSKQLEAIEARSSTDACEFDPAEDSAELSVEESSKRCPCCGAVMILQEQSVPPRWDDVMRSWLRPPWYSPPTRRATLPISSANT
jgi:hypothetical protein